MNLINQTYFVARNVYVRFKHVWRRRSAPVPRLSQLLKPDYKKWIKTIIPAAEAHWRGSLSSKMQLLLLFMVSNVLCKSYGASPRKYDYELVSWWLCVTRTSKSFMGFVCRLVEATSLRLHRGYLVKLGPTTLSMWKARYQAPSPLSLALMGRTIGACDSHDHYYIFVQTHTMSGSSQTMWTNAWLISGRWSMWLFLMIHSILIKDICSTLGLRGGASSASPSHLPDFGRCPAQNRHRSWQW